MRLVGSDAEIIAVAHEAQRVCAGDEALSVALMSLSRARKDSNRAWAATDSGAPAADSSGPAAERGGTAWAVALGVGLLGAVIFAIAFAPAHRGATMASPDVAQMAMRIGIAPAVLGLLIARVTDASVPHARLNTGSMLSATFGLLLVGAFGYRLVVGTSRTGLSVGTLTVWMIIVAALATTLFLLAMRWRKRSRAAEEVSHSRPHGSARVTDENRRLLTYTHDLASGAAPWGRDAVEAESWAASVVRLNHMGPETIAQAKSLGPRAWLVWAVYDARVDVSSLRLR